MTTKMISLFALCVLLGAVMLACGGAADNANTANTANTANANAKTTSTPATSASPAATPAATPAAAGGDIGVAECDDFLKKYEACVNGKVPAAVQATFKSTLDAWRASWKKAVETPQGKAALGPQCKAAADQAKASLGSYGCAW